MARNVPSRSGKGQYGKRQERQPMAARLHDVPVADHGLVLFMQAARWADDIRTRDKA